MSEDRFHLARHVRFSMCVSRNEFLVSENRIRVIGNEVKKVKRRIINITYRFYSSDCSCTSLRSRRESPTPALPPPTYRPGCLGTCPSHRHRSRLGNHGLPEYCKSVEKCIIFNAHISKFKQSKLLLDTNYTAYVFV